MPCRILVAREQPRSRSGDSNLLAKCFPSQICERHFGDNWAPSTKWPQGGPIIEREKIDIVADPNGKDIWMGRNYSHRAEYTCFGPTPLIAAMRCYVASRLGESVDVPEELL